MSAGAPVTVCTIEIPATELHEGSIVVTGGRARYLRKLRGTFLRYLQWEYTRHNPDGSIAGQGVMEVRADSMVTVVATVDGQFLVP